MVECRGHGGGRLPVPVWGWLPEDLVSMPARVWRGRPLTGRCGKRIQVARVSGVERLVSFWACVT